MFEITPMQEKQNVYVDSNYVPNRVRVTREHGKMTKAFTHTPVYVYKVVPHEKVHLPDIVFIANGGLSLPRLPEPCILLPHMKYIQRKRELPYLKGIFSDLGLATIPFPGSATAPFEGQAELKWFRGGRLAVGGYGYRSTKKSFEVLKGVFADVYGKHGIEPPKILALPLESENYYHLDVAMLEHGNKCIVHKRAFSAASILALESFLGKDNVYVLDTTDSFCLNAVVDGTNLITHILSDPKVKGVLERITGLQVKEVDTSEFEKSGGSVRCMTLDVYSAN
jgi:N-dimethylarginine dimethylaminohydrolase